MNSQNRVQLTLSDLPLKLKLVAVTKNRKPEECIEVFEEFKITQIAENRLKEAEEKFPHLESWEIKTGTKLIKHFIGKLQSRKIKSIVKLFDRIQSVENSAQAKKIAKHAKELGKVPYPIFIQINISGKDNRSGVPLIDFQALKTQILKIKDLKLMGVMGMASTKDSAEAERVIRSEFSSLKKVQGSLEECSMGMSSDYQLAIKEGSTMLRLGTILFTS
jgi:pyridoxal phosphate enzyme (YggS family)